MSPPHLGYQVVFDSQIYCRCAKSESELYQATSGPIQWVWSHVWMGYDWGEATCSSHLTPSHTCDEYCILLHDHIGLATSLFFFFFFWFGLTFDLIPNQHQTWPKRENGLNFEVLALIAGKWRAAVKAPLKVPLWRWSHSMWPLDSHGPHGWCAMSAGRSMVGEACSPGRAAPVWNPLNLNAEAQSIQQWMQRISGLS